LDPLEDILIHPTHSQKVLVLTSTWKYMDWRKTMNLRKTVSESLSSKGYVSTIAMYACD